MALVIRPSVAVSFVLLLGVFAVDRPASAQNAADPGLYVSVPNPITSDAYTRIKNRVEAARAKARPAVVVFDFNPESKDAASPDVGPCADLADYISRLDVTTVGYVHRKTTGHTVLPVLACQQIVCGPQAVLGEVVRGGDPPLGAIAVGAYQTITERVHPAYVAVARKMHDSGVQLRKGQKTGGGAWFVDARDRANLPASVQVTDTAASFAPDRVVGTFTASQLRDMGLSSRTVDSQQELLETYGLTSAALRDDTFGGRAPVGFHYVLRGRVDGGTKEAVERVAREALRQNANILFLQIECAGGDLQAARDLAQALTELQKPTTVGGEALRVVAFIPDRAPDTAAVVALGCAEIVMSKRTDASPEGGEETPSEAMIGEFQTYFAKHKDQNPVAWAASLHALAEQHGHPAILADGMVDANIEILRASKKTNRSVRRLMSRAEYEADVAKGDKAEWQLMNAVKPKGQLLTLTATQAEELGLARFTTDGRDPAEVYGRYGVESGKVKEAAPAWLDKFAAFLKLPVVTVLLVVIGFAGLMLEMKVPGTTIPGIIAALCFILVFWAHTQFSGQVAVLAGLLFLLGIVLILLEIFVLPGFGVTGIIGVLVMLGSLALVTVDQTPNTWDGALEFASRMATYLLAMVGGLGLALLVARYLPNIPYANRLMLPPPGEAGGEGPALASLPGAEQAASLLGAVGTSVTVLRPAGTVRFGEEFVDVVTDGGYVPAGARVQVIEVEGTRIVVKEV